MFGEKLDRWSKRMEWPLTAAAFLFLVAYATQIIAKPTSTVDAIAETVIWVTWAVFLVDYLVRLTITEHRWR